MKAWKWLNLKPIVSITYKCSDQISESTSESSLVSTAIAIRALNKVYRFCNTFSPKWILAACLQGQLWYSVAVQSLIRLLWKSETVWEKGVRGLAGGPQLISGLCWGPFSEPQWQYICAWSCTLLILTLTCWLDFKPTSSRQTRLAVTGLLANLAMPAFFGTESLCDSVTVPLRGHHCPCLLLLQASAPGSPSLAEQPTLLLPTWHWSDISVKPYFGRPTFCLKWVTTSQTVVLRIILVCSFQNSKNWKKSVSIHCCLGGRGVFIFPGFFKVLVPCKCYTYSWEVILVWNE